MRLSDEQICMRLAAGEQLAKLGKSQYEAGWAIRAIVEELRGKGVGWDSIAGMLEMNTCTLRRQYLKGDPIVAVRFYDHNKAQL